MTVTKTQKDAETEGEATRAPEVPDHPDKIITGGDGVRNVFRWTGNLTHVVHKQRDITETFTDGNGNKHRISYVQDGGEETVHLEGKCADCGREIYTLAEGNNPGLIGLALAVFARGGLNEPPVMYCYEHDPGASHRKNGSQMLDDNGRLKIDGGVLR